MRRLLLSLLLVPATLIAQDVLFQGTVIAENDGKPLPGANILFPEFDKGVSSDENGRFELEIPKPTSTEVEISFVGMESLTKEIQLKAGFNTHTFYLSDDAEVLNEVVLTSKLASEVKSPATVKTLSKKDLEKINLGQDIPVLLEMTPSMVIGTDAGAGIGYTNMRLRGTDGTRIHVTINGIPVNDAESHGVFWVDLPDLAASAENIRVQRGVGLSNNGTGAFGGSIDVNTFRKSTQAEAGYSFSTGSFNTMKNSVFVNSGRLKSGFQVDGRISAISSDGYIDRASSNLRSYYLGAKWNDSKNALRFTVFGGQERTYQAWYGVPSDSLQTNRTFNPYTYKDEVDNYGQTYYQLHYNRKLNSLTDLQVSFYRTYGAGYFEQFQGASENQFTYNTDTELADYGILAMHNGDTIEESEIIRRRWLDNVLDGVTFNLTRKTDKWTSTLGGGLNTYSGLHFGEVIWAEFAGNSRPGHRYYENTAIKSDANVYLRNEYWFSDQLLAYADLQYRAIQYTFNGSFQDQDSSRRTETMNFFNPKAGLVYKIDNRQSIYASIGMANKEPNRNDFVNSRPGQTPKHETLIDFELAYERFGNRYAFAANAYYMQYKNQLVENGNLNDVGASLRDNIDNSFRRGIELMFNYNIYAGLYIQGNLALSQNIAKEYVDYVDNWDTGLKDTLRYENTSLAFSPSAVSAVSLLYRFKNSLQIELQNKYVSRRYIDNTETMSRSLDPYFFQNLIVSYTSNNIIGKETSFNLKVNNLLSTEYISNAWVYRFNSQGFDPTPFDPYADYGDKNGEYQSIGYFPQALRNVLVGVNIKF